MKKKTLIIFSIFLTQIIFSIGYFYSAKTEKYTSASNFKDSSFSNATHVTTHTTRNSKDSKLQKLPEALIIGESKCGLLFDCTQYAFS